MGFKASGEVFERSTAKNGDLLVLLYLAHCTNDARGGASAFPSVKRIGLAINRSERSVQASLRRLEEAGEIERMGVSHLGTFAYSVSVVDGASKFAAFSPTPAENDVDPRRFEQGGVQKMTGSMSKSAPNQKSDQKSDQKKNNVVDFESLTPHRHSLETSTNGSDLRSEFDELWALWPNKVREEKAYENYRETRAAGVTHSDLIEAASRYLAWQKSLVTGSFKPNPAQLNNWLSEKRYTEAHGGTPATADEREKLRAIWRARSEMLEGARSAASRARTGPYSPAAEALIESHRSEWEEIAA